MSEFTPADLSRVQLERDKRRLELYRPYFKQQQFHRDAGNFRETLLRAGNQQGKTLCAAANTAIHATGRYPDWWEGVRLKKAPVIWCAGVTGEVVRDSIQKLLIGDSANPGTGFIPADDIIETTPSRGVADLIDTIYVKHASGGKTRIRLKYYEQGREKFQADTVDVVWLDEECDLGIYTEALTRTNATKGFLYMTFTPLKGMSEVVRKFLNEKSPDRCDINMTIEDALHISPVERQKIIDSYPLHERTARIMGQPILGSGRIFPIAEEDIKCDPFDMASVPFFWQEIAGIDFGWDHPTAAVKMLYNPQDDIIYVTNTYKRSEQTPLIHAAALKPWGTNVPWAWPHDGLIHDKNSGEQLSVTYRELGMKMMGEHATFESGSNSVEAGLTDMLMRMQTGRWKVFSHLHDWFEEFRLYHRKDGKVLKEYDDLMACLHPDSEIITDKGVRKIIDMVGTEGHVLTIDGKWNDYKNCRMTRADAELVKVTYSDGHELVCTPDHKLLSYEGEWVSAIDSAGMLCHNAVSHQTNTKNSLAALCLAEEKCGFKPKKANSILSILSVQRLKERSDVYCMEVPATQAFAIANGAVVHNCSRYALMMLRNAARVRKVAGMMGGYAIEEEESRNRVGNMANYNPLSREICRGVKRGI